jgi:hypothetical protein
MPSLAEFQARARGAIVDGDMQPLAPVLLGARDPQRRFAIHRRHYQASLTRALVEKFPAVNWLAGSPLLTEAARAYIRRHPPRSPCIAEYGERFPAFLADWPRAARLPWIRFVGELEWQIGRAALAVEHAPLAADALAAVPAADLPDVRLQLQTGLRYLAAPWPVDDLVKLFLSEAAPERYELAAEDVFIEIRGVRGAFEINRLSPGTFAFRCAIAEGRSIGAAATQAAEAEPSFDPGRALAVLLAGGLVIAAVTPAEGGER